MAPRLLIGSVRRKYSLPLLGCPLPSRFVPVRFHLQDDTGVHAIDHRLHFWPAVASRAREDHLWSGSQLNRIILGWDTRVRVRVLVLGLRYKVLGYLLGEGAPLLPQHVGYLEGALARILHELWRALRDVDHLQICVQKAAVREGTAIGFAAGRRHTEDTGLHRGAACGDAGNRLVVYLAW